MWPATKDVVNREIEMFRSFAGIEPVNLGTKCRMLNRYAT